MVAGRIRVGLERILAERSLRRAAARAAPPVPKDENNIFSLHDAAVIGDVAAVSFDLFDTLAQRRHLSLDQVMRKTADLAADLVPGDRARVVRRILGARGFCAEALKREMQASGMGDEPALEAVFDRALAPLVEDTAARRALARRLVDLETEVEIRNLSANPEALPALRAVRASGRRVVVTSDMYLPGRSIARILASLGLADLVDHLFVSSDAGVTKAGGGLFAVVAEELGLPPGQILHIGDNWQSDVVMARRSGLRALHYVNADWQAAAQALARRGALRVGDRLRRDRIARGLGLAGQRPMASIEAMIDGLIGPAAGLFVADTLAAAERRGSSDVFFLTRDGTVFLEIANEARRRGTPLPAPSARLAELAASRATGSLLAAPARNAEGLVSDICYLSEGGFSTAALFTFHGLAEEDFASCGPEVREALAAALAGPGEAPFRALMERPAFRAALARALSARRDAVAAYLAGAGLFAARAPVLADIGYSGTWAKQLSVLLEDMSASGRDIPAMEFRFFASNRHFDGNLPRLHPAIDLVPGVLLDHRDGACLTAALNFAWLEPFFADPRRGALEGFASASGGITPVFADPGFDAATASLLATRRARLVQRAADFLEDMLRHEGDLVLLRDILRAGLVRLAERPTLREVCALNAARHQRGMRTIAHQPVACRIRPGRLAARLSELRANDYWVQGSLRLSGLGFLNPFLRLHPGVDRIPLQEAAR
jgi:HAD superfamily hydrolase (TIGR01549 family)